MEQIGPEQVPELLERCHRALMKVWNGYRERMHRLGFETHDATQHVAAVVVAKLHQLRDRTLSGFCAWSRAILLSWIRAELRRMRPEHLDSRHDQPDSEQPSPSQDYQATLRELTYQAARAALPDHERVLIELRYEERVPHEKNASQFRRLELAEVRARLQADHPDLWRQHASEWSLDANLGAACRAAKHHFNELAADIHRELGGDLPNELV